MPNETLSYGRGTRGSYSTLLTEPSIHTRSGLPLRRYSEFRALIEDPEADSSYQPVQSFGDSRSSIRIENYLDSALAGFAGLATALRRSIRMTASPEARAAQMDPWAVKNGRRIRLIEKKYKEGLSENESAELSRLKNEVYAHLQTIDPRSTRDLNAIESRIERLKRRIEAKKESKT